MIVQIIEKGFLVEPERGGKTKDVDTLVIGKDLVLIVEKSAKTTAKKKAIVNQVIESVFKTKRARKKYRIV